MGGEAGRDSTGSSPRAGRRRGCDDDVDGGGGLIPASGETTRPAPRTTPPGTAHPRERGDDTHLLLGTGPVTGSSPRAGRRPGRGRCGRGRAGLIPASGETTRSKSPHRTAVAAHPRERGDDGLAAATIAFGVGSSPRAGRRPEFRDGQRQRPGLIPASGETTTRGPRSTRVRGAHPRERGDDVRMTSLRSWRMGSSPRAGRRRPVEPLHGCI